MYSLAVVFASVFGVKLISKNSNNQTTTVAAAEFLTTIISTEIPVTAETTTETTTAPTTKPTVSSPVIPDPGAYFRLSRHEDGCFGLDDARYYCISYKTDLSYPQALQEYISIISDNKYQFELIHKHESSSIFSYKSYGYYFNYTGEKDIPDLIADTKSDVDCDLKVSITYFPADDPGDYDHAYLSLRFNPDAPFKLVDPECRTSFTLRDLSYIP